MVCCAEQNASNLSSSHGYSLIQLRLYISLTFLFAELLSRKVVKLGDSSNFLFLKLRIEFERTDKNQIHNIGRDDRNIQGIDVTDGSRHGGCARHFLRSPVAEVVDDADDADDDSSLVRCQRRRLLGEN